MQRVHIRWPGSLRFVPAGLVLSMIVSGGVAAGFHSGGNIPLVKTITAPYAGSFEESMARCTPIPRHCTSTSNASADASIGTMKSNGFVGGIVTGAPYSGDAYAGSTITAVDVLENPVAQRGYTITVHVDRASTHKDDVTDHAGDAGFALQIETRHSACSCQRSTWLDVSRLGDFTAFIDYDALPAGAVSISVTLRGFAYTVIGTSTSEFDGEATLSKVEVYS